MNGWITAFFAHKQTSAGPVQKPNDLFEWNNPPMFGGFGQNEFPAHVSKVSFTWNYLDKRIPMWFVSGVLGVDWDEGFMRPRLGYAVVEPLGAPDGDVRRHVQQGSPIGEETSGRPSRPLRQFWKKLTGGT